MPLKEIIIVLAALMTIIIALLQILTKYKVLNWLMFYIRRFSPKNLITSKISEEPINAGDKSEFVRDVTPDGHIVQVKEHFTHTWEIRNAGGVIWDNRYLARIGPYDSSGIIKSAKRVRIPYTRPGQSVKVSVKLRAPDIPGSFKIYWKMVDGNGKQLLPNQIPVSVSVHVTYGKAILKD